MDVMVKTKELCQALVNSSEFQELVRAETILKYDLDAQELVNQFNSLQNKLQTLYQQGKKADQADFRQLREIEKKMSVDPTLDPYLKAQQKFNNLLGNINNMINEVIKIDNKQNGSSNTCGCGQHKL